jgi:aldose 1-epimerase
MTSLRVDGKELLLGFGEVQDYFADTSMYLGATCGRFANRIANGRYQQAGQTASLPTNNGRHCLHGGPNGYHMKQWTVTRTFEGADECGVVFALESPHLDEGFLGNLFVEATFVLRMDPTLSRHAALEIKYRGSGDESIFNVVNHNYWNLNGAGSGSILNHTLTVFGEYFTPVDAESIPTGEIRLVADTPLDFRSPRPIGEAVTQMKDFCPSARADKFNSEGKWAGGVDHNFFITGNGFRRCALLSDPGERIRLTLYSDYPCLQVYSGNYIANQTSGGREFSQHCGVCLEPQYPPNAPNVSHFPCAFVKKGDAIERRVVAVFEVEA